MSNIVPAIVVLCLALTLQPSYMAATGLALRKQADSRQVNNRTDTQTDTRQIDRHIDK